MMPINEEIKFNHEKMNNSIKVRMYTHNSSGLLSTLLNKSLKYMTTLENKGYEINHIFYENLYEFSNLITSKLLVQKYEDYEELNTDIELANIMIDHAYVEKDIGQILSIIYDLRDDMIEMGFFGEIGEKITWISN